MSEMETRTAPASSVVGVGAGTVVGRPDREKKEGGQSTESDSRAAHCFLVGK